MGWRFRKSVSLGKGVRLNFGKKSTSISFGRKGYRKTYRSTGRQTTTVSIPGSGLSYSTTSGGKKSSAKRKKQSTPATSGRKKGCGIGCLGTLVIILLMGVVGAAFNSNDNKNDLTSSSSYTSISQTKSEEATTKEKAIISDEAVNTTEKTTTTQKATTTQKTTTTQKATTTQEYATKLNNEIMVYITETGKKYHNKSCRYYTENCIEMTIEEAQQAGYEPCQVCGG